MLALAVVNHGLYADMINHREGGVRRRHGLRSLRLSVSLPNHGNAADLLGQARRFCGSNDNHTGVEIMLVECGGSPESYNCSSMTTPQGFLPSNLSHELLTFCVVHVLSLFPICVELVARHVYEIQRPALSVVSLMCLSTRYAPSRPSSMS